MRRINVAEDIVSVAEFRERTTQLLRRLHETRRPLVITLAGKPAAVVVTPEEFEELDYRDFVRAKVRSALESAARGPTMSSREARRHLKAQIRSTPRES